MGRGPRDFESRASTSFTTPALSVGKGGMTLFYHISEGVSRVLAREIAGAKGRSRSVTPPDVGRSL